MGPICGHSVTLGELSLGAWTEPALLLEPSHAKAAFSWPCLSDPHSPPFQPTLNGAPSRRAGGSQDLILQIRKAGLGGEGGHGNPAINPESVVQPGRSALAREVLPVRSSPRGPRVARRPVLNTALLRQEARSFPSSACFCLPFSSATLSTPTLLAACRPTGPWKNW